jgi:hypothetical protein
LTPSLRAIGKGKENAKGREYVDQTRRYVLTRGHSLGSSDEFEAEPAKKKQAVAKKMKPAYVEID